jgi:hypothetical protein
MFTLTGRTFVAYEDKNLGRSTVGLLTQSQGNTNEDEWFSLFVNLIESNSKVHVASFRGMVVNIEEVKSIIFRDNNQRQRKIKRLKALILDKLQEFEKNL